MAELLEDRALLSGHGLHDHGAHAELDWNQFAADAGAMIEAEFGTESAFGTQLITLISEHGSQEHGPDTECTCPVCQGISDVSVAAHQFEHQQNEERFHLDYHALVDSYVGLASELGEQLEYLLHAYEFSVTPEGQHQHPVYAPGTSYEYMDAHPDAMDYNESGIDFHRANRRWTSTTTPGDGTAQGDRAIVTWSILRDSDNVTIPSAFSGDSSDPSNFISWQEGIYGSTGDNDEDYTDEPWFDELNTTMDRWGDLTNLTYVYEPNDDGASFPGSPGVLGTRGDVRIGAHRIDGNSGVLAYNYFPNTGDMVFDSADGFYNSTAGNSLRLRNVMSHEAGHGKGISHVESNNASFLMEPFINLSFDGPQFDDILGAQRQYGDIYENGSNNDTTTNAYDLGTIANGDTTTIGEDAVDLVVTGNNNVLDAGDVDFVSIDDNGDTDFFKVTVDGSGQLEVTITPLGPTYNEGCQGCSQSSYDTSSFSDLRFEIFDTDGTTSLTGGVVDNTGVGLAETATATLPGAGTYFIRINGAANNVQMYQLDATYTAIDYGDAPASYGTLLANDGARHLDQGVRLGALRDDEPDGLPSVNADGDGADDADGVTFSSPITPGSPFTVTVDIQNATSTATEYLSLWIDWNGNGVFDAAEQMVTDSATTGDGIVLLNLTAPAHGYGVGSLDAYGRGSDLYTYTRVRVSSQSGLGPIGFAQDGEVQDDRISITDPALGHGFASASNLTLEGDITRTDTTVKVVRSAIGNPDFLNANSTVDVVLTANTADDGVDYTSGPVAVNFNAGETEVAAPIEILGEFMVEPDEIVDLSLQIVLPNQVIFGQTSSSLTIQNDDTASVELEDSFSQLEGSAGGLTTFEFDVTLDNPVQGGFDIGFTASDGTATAADDFTVDTTSPITFTGTAGEVQKIQVSVNADKKVEADEVFDIVLGAISGLKGGIDPADVTADAVTSEATITNDDTAVLTLEGVSISQVEGTGGTSTDFSFRVTLDNPVQDGLNLAYTTNDGTATAADDYTDNDGTLNFTGTASEMQNITVKVLHDTKVEADELFNVALGAISGLAAGIDPADITTSGTPLNGTIQNDDQTTLLLEDSFSQLEGDGGGTTDFVFDVTLGAAVQGGFDVAFGVTPDTATPDDYTTTTGSPISFTGLAGEIKTITVAVDADEKVEADEVFEVLLGALSGLAPGVDSADITVDGVKSLGTITNDDTAVLTLSGVTNTQAEGTGGVSTNFVFRVTLDNPVQGGLDLAYTTDDGTAVAADDYTDNDATLAFAGRQGETFLITVQVGHDNKVEADEVFSVALGAVSGLAAGIDPADITTGGSPQLGTITNDDTTTIELENSFTQAEGNGGGTTNFVFDVTLGAPVQGGFDLAFSINDGTATAADDFTVPTGSPLSFSGTTGEVETITVAVTADGKVEADEVFDAVLGLVSNLAPGVDSADITVDAVTTVATIANDDTATLTLSGVSASQNEGTGGTTTDFVFRVTLDTEVDGGLSVAYTTDDDTALAGSDYIDNDSSLAFAGTAGETADITVQVNHDATREDDEFFDVLLGAVTTNGPGVDASDVSTAGSPQRGTILNDDQGLCINLNGTKLEVCGTELNDLIVIRLNATTVFVSVTPAGGVTTSQSFPAASVATVDAIGREGNDRIIIKGSTALDATLDGGLGDDLLVGGAGTELLLGGPGRDIIKPKSGGGIVDGQGGDDRLIAGDGDDTLIGGDGNDRLVAKQGNNSLQGGNGNDTLSGGAGNDTLSGGPGADVLSDKAGTNLLQGDADADRLISNGGTSTLQGGDGPDKVVAKSGNNRLEGNADNDTMVGGNGGDTLFGGAGDDVLNAHRTTGTLIHGEDGADKLNGGSGGDTLNGGLGNDTLKGKSGNDVLNGDEDADSLTAGAGDDTLDGGVGADKLLGSSGSNLLLGGDGDDTITGGTGSDVVRGGAGVEIIKGGDGNDVLFGGAGSDTVDGQKGDDIVAPGTTDLTNAQLLLVQLEWNSPRTYVERVNNIRNGSGTATRDNGTAFLDNGTFGGTQTIFNDGAADVDIMKGKSEQDWFFAAVADSVLDADPGEFLDSL